MCKGRRNARRVLKSEKGADRSGRRRTDCVMCWLCKVVIHDIPYFVDYGRITVSLGASQDQFKLISFKVSYTVLTLCNKQLTLKTLHLKHHFFTTFISFPGGAFQAPLLNLVFLVPWPNAARCSAQTL